MNTVDYEAWVQSRCKPFADLNYAIIALNGEAGEVAEWHKKFNLRGNPTGQLSNADLKEELGDVQFYLTRIAQLNGWSLSEIMESNVDKIEARVKEGMRSVG